jgi:acyl carrier protein
VNSTESFGSPGEELIVDRASLKQRLADLLEQTTGEKYENISEEDNLRESLNLDSIDLVSVVFEIQNQLSIFIAGNELNQIVQVRDLLDLLEAKLASGKSAA